MRDLLIGPSVSAEEPRETSSPEKAQASMERRSIGLAAVILLLLSCFSRPATAVRTVEYEITCDVADPVCGQEVTFRVQAPTLRYWIIFTKGGESEYFTVGTELRHVFDLPGTYYVQAVVDDTLFVDVRVKALEVHVRQGSGFPHPADAKTGGLAFEETFSGDVSDWSRGDDGESEWGVEDQWYHIVVRKEMWARWAWAPLDEVDFGDLAVSVDMELTAGSIGGGGVIWGPTNDDFFVFYVDQLGRYELKWQSEDSWQTSPTPAMAAVAIHPVTAPNHLELRLRGSSAFLFANGELLDVVELKGYEKGRVGIYTGTGSDVDPYCRAQFDNLRITDDVGNLPPTAAISSELDEDQRGLVSFDASLSSDPDGHIVRYAWAFGDGATATGKAVSHWYASVGWYTVTLTVEDDGGATSVASKAVAVFNRYPWAAFTFSPPDPVEGPVQFDASASYDPDGVIARYEWNFGDGSTGTGETPAHTYTRAGTYLPSLTVIDDSGAALSATRLLVIRQGNKAPVASFTWQEVGEDGERVAVEPRAGEPLRFDASESSDPDGEIALYSWDWDGDGVYDLAGADPDVSHVFSLAGTYRVTLQVTDDDGGVGTTSQLLTVAEANAWPTAKFTWAVVASDGTRLVVEPRRGDTIRFDASESVDVDGEIVGYAWDWESEGTYDWTAVDPVVAYMFPEAGVHRVTLQVTDDDGATATTSQVVAVNERRGPTAALAITPASPSILDAVQFTDVSQPGDQPIISWRWTFGDGTESSEQHPTHQYATKGTFAVTLIATDADEETSQATGTVEVVNILPTAVGEVEPESGSVGWVLTFDARRSSDADGEVVSFAWDWESDGVVDATSGEPLVQHVFLAAGTYWVTLVVTDNDGASVKQQVAVTVSEKPVVVEPQEVWAVVVGINAYADVKQLTYARADAEAFAAWLGEAGVVGDHMMTLYDDQATLIKVRAALGWLRRNAEADDLVFFYFAGHGYQREDDNGDDAVDGLDEFLALYDTQADAMDETGLRDDEFGRFLDQVSSQHVMVVFDSCFSGGQERSLPGSARPLGDTFDLLTDFSLEGKLVLAAASESQESKEHSSFGHGVFTHFLLEGLAGAADDDADFRITADELFRYTQPRVADFVRRTFGKNQTPELSGRGMPGIVLSQLNQPPRAEFDVEPLVPSMSVATRFVDKSSDDRAIVSWEWAFGDGSVSTEQHAVHVYPAAATYMVMLTVVDGDGLEGTYERSVVVAPPGEVTSAVTNGELTVSLGNSHGVGVGDRFDVVRMVEGSSGQWIVEHKAVVEIVKVASAVRSVARVISQEFPVELHDLLVIRQP